MIDRDTTQSLTAQIVAMLDTIYTMSASGDLSRQEWQEIAETVRWIADCANEV